MVSELRARQETEGQVRYDRIAPVLERYGKIDSARERGDYWLVDENLGWWRQTIETDNLKLLDPAVIRQLQDLLAGYPDWEIWVVVVLDEQKNTVPPMGLIIAEDEIIDELQRDFLPPEFRDLTYPGSKQRKPWL